MALALVGLIGFTSFTTFKEVETKVVQNVEEIKNKTKQLPNIVDLAASNDNFSILVKTLKATNLLETLSNGKESFTVFAPPNDAFNALPEGTVTSLLKTENKDKLTSILTYHLVPGNFDAATVIKAVKDNNGTFTVKTVQGQEIKIMVVGGNVILQDANGNKSSVIKADVKASNGIIHVIDSVVMPK